MEGLVTPAPHDRVSPPGDASPFASACYSPVDEEGGAERMIDHAWNGVGMGLGLHIRVTSPLFRSFAGWIVGP